MNERVYAFGAEFIFPKIDKGPEYIRVGQLRTESSSFIDAIALSSSFELRTKFWDLPKK